MSTYPSAKRQRLDQAGAHHNHIRAPDPETKSKSRSAPPKPKVKPKSQSQPEPVSESAPPQRKEKSNPQPHHDAGSAWSKHQEDPRLEHPPRFTPSRHKSSKSRSKPEPRHDSLPVQDKSTSKPEREPERNAQLDAEPDALNHLLNSLDGLDRATHLGNLQTRAAAARDLLSTAKCSLRTYQNHIALLSGELRRTRQYADKVATGETGFDARTDKEKGSRGEDFLVTEKYLRRRRRRIARGRVNLEIGEKLLEKQGRLCAHADGLYEAVRQWVQALQTLASLWTRIWNLYESMNEVGPSSRPRNISTEWKQHTKTSLWRHLVQIETEVQTASREANEAQAALAKDSLAIWEEHALDWGARIIGMAHELPFSLLCGIKHLPRGNTKRSTEG